MAQCWANLRGPTGMTCSSAHGLSQSICQSSSRRRGWGSHAQGYRRVVLLMFALTHVTSGHQCQEHARLDAIRDETLCFLQQHSARSVARSSLNQIVSMQEKRISKERWRLIDSAALGALLLAGVIVLLVASVKWTALQETERKDVAREVPAQTSIIVEPERPQGMTPNVIVLGCILIAFFAVGPGLVMVNKRIQQTLAFSYPLTVSSLGIGSSAIFARGIVCSGTISMRQATLDAVAGRQWYKVVLPIAIAKALTLSCGNAVYLYLGLGFIQMLKAFNPAIIVVILKMSGMATPSRHAVLSVCVIILGTIIVVNGELHCTILGLLLMFTSEVAEAFTLVLSQGLLQDLQFTVVESLYMIAPPTMCCLLGAAAVTEWPRIYRAGDATIIRAYPVEFAASAVLGLLVNFISLAVVQATSSLTLKVLNTARTVGLVIVGVLWYGEQCSLQEGMGYGVALMGFTGYNIALANPQPQVKSTA